MAGEGPSSVLAPVRSRRPHAAPRAGGCPARTSSPHSSSWPTQGIHDPGTMPFFVPWTDVEPAQRARESAQWLWRHRANWSADKWTFTGAAFVDGQPDRHAGHGGRALPRRALGRDRVLAGASPPGPGLGREMREAILHLAFEGLGAEEALSGAFEDNAASLATSRAVGYEENGEARGHAARRVGPHRPLPDRPRRPGSPAARRHRDRRARGLPRHVRRSADRRRTGRVTVP